jgi:tetratricopeptide (TPR) repeat protein
MSTACPSCSHVNTDTARFCLKCGAPLRAPEPVAAEAPAASAPVAQPEAAPQVTSTVQETPFGSVNVNVTLTPRPPPLPPPPPTFAPKPTAAAAASAAAPAAKSGGSTGLIIGVVAVAAIAGAAFMFMGKGDAPKSASAPAAAGPVAQPLSSKEILNQILGLVRDNRWQDVKPKVTSLKELVQVTKGNRQNSEKLVGEAEKLMSAGSYGDAVSPLEKAIAEDPSFADPRHMLGRALTRSGKSDAARAVLLDALVNDPERAATWLAAAEMFAEIDKPDESFYALKLALHFSKNREAANQFLQDKSRFPSAKFWVVVENNRSALAGVPQYK